MPAVKAGESKQALVVTLVFFILLSIVLGILTYMGYSDADKYDKEKKTAENNEKNAKSERDTQRNMNLLYRAYLGVPAADKAELPVAYTDYTSKVAGKGDKDGNDKALADLEKNLGWDKQKGLPNTDMVRAVAELQKKNKEFQDQLAQKDEELKKREADVKKARTDRDNAEVEFKKQLADLGKRADDDLKKYEKAVADARTEYGDQGKQIEQLKEALDNLLKEKEKLGLKKDKEIKDLHTQLARLEDRKPKYNALTFDKPKGKIVLMGKTGELPYINLGNADRVKPQLTFAIHGTGADGRPTKDPKGSLEVIHVIGEHLSQARITNQADAAHDPVVTGDVLINPAWDPNQQRHIAIAGIVDLTGDARKDRPTEADRAVKDFMRALENQNMVVDAWLDIINNSIQGKGISRNTDYLILAPLPEERGYGTVREDDPKTRQRDDVRKLATKMQDEATRMGVPIIKLRDFLTMTGFRQPRTQEDDNLRKVHSSVPAITSPLPKPAPAASGSDKKDSDSEKMDADSDKKDKQSDKKEKDNGKKDKEN
jgi:hypothetical protein